MGRKRRYPARLRDPLFGRAVVVLPYLSIVAEKQDNLRKLVQGMGWGVRGYTSEAHGMPLSHRVGG